jgi:hypothetical protein
MDFEFEDGDGLNQPMVGHRSAPCGRAPGKIGALEPPRHSAHLVLLSSPGTRHAGPTHFHEDTYLEFRVSAWVLRCGEGAVADCEALRPPRQFP